MNRKNALLGAVVAACIALAMLPTSAFAVTRDVVIARGMVWANRVQSGSGAKTVYGVKYSQSRWAYENGALVPTSTSSPSTKGYRTDCSGFASLCYNLKDSSGRPYSECTLGFGAKGSKRYFEITKAQLQPGDMVLASAVWGAPGPHVIIFNGWVDAAQTQFWALEQTSSSAHNGTIYHARSYPPDKGRYPKGKTYYKAYRYSGLEDAFADVEESISGPDQYQSAASAVRMAFSPTHSVSVPALVIANASNWGDQTAAAAMAGALRGTTLLVGQNSLPTSTTAEIKRLKPKRIILIGSSATVSKAVQTKITSLCADVVRVEGNDRFKLSANLLKSVKAEANASGLKPDTVYVVSGDESDEALTIAPVLAKTARPVLFVNKASVPAAGLLALKRSGLKKVVILGSEKVVTAAVQSSLAKAGFKVTRVAGIDRYKTSMAIVNHALSLGVGFNWKHFGVASPNSWTDVLAWAPANGTTGSLVALTQAKALDANVRRAAAAHRAEIGKARVYGGSAVSQAARKTLAIALRTGK